MMQAVEAMTREDHQVILDALNAEDAELTKDIEAAGGFTQAAYYAPDTLDRLAAVRRVLRWL